MFKRVLILAEWATAPRIVSWVRRLLTPEGGDVRLLAVLPPARAVVADGRTVVSADRDEDGRRRATEFAFDSTVLRLRQDGLGASAEVRFGEPVTTLLRTAHEWRADAIAVALTPLHGWRQWLSIPVADDILERSPVPVLVARARGQRSA
jgi:nucleotide-binding universal stress UspA family protein